ncbi:MAG: DUF4269 domain-containing protein [Gammaproteobacteria bacterium]|nr:DUF4269 domain-containing protein [Gammaproteobacteria bacterium]
MVWFQNWRDVRYLTQGTLRQQQALAALSNTRVLDVLVDFDPILAGTIPLDVDIDGSDLDIICCVPDAMRFATCVVEAFSGLEGFSLRRGNIHGDYTTLAGFRADGFEFEIFGQNVPVDHQAAVVHLDVEARLLALSGEASRAKIRELKRSGMKTEPAFAAWLQLEGDPWDVLYSLGSANDATLRKLLEKVTKDRVND